MKTPRLLDAESDFKSLGMNKAKIEVWEDGKRIEDITKPNVWEWWYMHVNTGDGYAVVAAYHYQTDEKGVVLPFMSLNLTKDGKKVKDLQIKHPGKTHSAEKDIANATIGKSFFKSLDGLNKYQVYVDADENEGFGIDIIIDRMAPSYRPGTGIYGFLDGLYMGWFCAVPGGTGKGTITVDGKKINIEGSAYHDHNWGNCAMNEVLENWLWCGGQINDMSIVASSVRFKPELGGGEGSYIYIIKDNQLVLNVINDNVHVLEGRALPQPDTKKPTSTECSFTYGDDKSKTIVTFTRLSDMASFPYTSSSKEWQAWYTRYGASVNVLSFDKTKGLAHETTGTSTLEVMDFKGKRIK